MHLSATNLWECLKHSMKLKEMYSLFSVEGHTARPTHSDLPTKASAWCAEESSQLMSNEHISN